MNHEICMQTLSAHTVPHPWSLGLTLSSQLQMEGRLCVWGWVGGWGWTRSVRLLALSQHTQHEHRMRSSLASLEHSRIVVRQATQRGKRTHVHTLTQVPGVTKFRTTNPHPASPCSPPPSLSQFCPPIIHPSKCAPCVVSPRPLPRPSPGRFPAALRELPRESVDSVLTHLWFAQDLAVGLGHG